MRTLTIHYTIDDNNSNLIFPSDHTANGTATFNSGDDAHQWVWAMRAARLIGRVVDVTGPLAHTYKTLTTPDARK